MKVLVYPHTMEIGGSQLNAIELAAAVRDLGHDVVVYGEPGELVAHVERLGLPFIGAAHAAVRPSPAVARDLRTIALREGLDVIHGYEWPPILEAYAAAGVGRRPAVIGTVMSMAVAEFIPTDLPLVVGTEAIRSAAAARRTGPVSVIEPPVDTDANQPGVVGGRGAWPVGESPRVVIVSRLAHELKLEGVLSAIRATASLAREIPVALDIIGDGPARDVVESAAREANSGFVSDVVTIVGALADPRAAYDAADICIGMGGSAIRALSYAKPLVVQGEGGFFELFTPASAETFFAQGFYGRGSREPEQAATELAAILRGLVDRPAYRAELGAFGRALAVERFSLHSAALRQEEIYAAAMRAPRRARDRVAAAAVSGRGLASYKIGRRVARWRGRSAADDFNATPVLAEAAR